MASYQVEDIRNIVLAGHGAVGKTTLADVMLAKAGAVDRAGSVDEGTSVSDFDEEEKARKFSIESSVLHLDWKGKRIHLIDTPGYPDFIGQYIGALRAAETSVIVLSAAAGIEVNTRRVFNEAEKAGVGRILVLNKMDAENIDFPALLDRIRDTFGPRCVLLNVPIGSGEALDGVVSTLSPPATAPGGALVDPGEIHQTLIDSIIESDEALMERFMEGETLSPEDVSGAIGKAVAAGTLIPILCTSARQGIGVEELLDALASCALAPGALERLAIEGSGESRQETAVAPRPDGPLVAQVFKTRIDPFVAKLTFLRLYSGSLAKDDSVTLARTGKSIKMGQLFRMQGSHQEPVDEAVAGDIVALAKMEELRIGDTLTSGKNAAAMPPIRFPRPMVGLAVLPKSRGDEQKISGSLNKIAEEDPAFLVTRDAQTKELVMTGMSELHLKVIQSRMKSRDKLEVETREPKVPYRETISTKSEGSYRHKKQTGGRGQFAEVHLRLVPLPRDLEDVESWCTKDRFPQRKNVHYHAENHFAFVDSVVGGVIPNQYIPAVEKGIVERMHQGVLAGHQIQDVAAEVHFGKYHPVDSSEAAFKIAGSLAFREAFHQAKPVLLEPIVNIEITVPGEKLGDITSDLNTRRGRVQGMDSLPGDVQVIRAQVPLAEVTTYARALSSMTGGQGSYTIEYSHYDIVPPNVQQQVVEAAKREKEEEQ